MPRSRSRGPKFLLCRQRRCVRQPTIRTYPLTPAESFCGRSHELRELEWELYRQEDELEDAPRTQGAKVALRPLEARSVGIAWAGGKAGGEANLASALRRARECRAWVSSKPASARSRGGGDREETRNPRQATRVRRADQAHDRVDVRCIGRGIDEKSAVAAIAAPEDLPSGP